MGAATQKYGGTNVLKIGEIVNRGTEAMNNEVNEVGMHKYALLQLRYVQTENWFK